jgi:hypothetical protein
MLLDDTENATNRDESQPLSKRHRSVPSTRLSQAPALLGGSLGGVMRYIAEVVTPHIEPLLSSQNHHNHPPTQPCMCVWVHLVPQLSDVHQHMQSDECAARHTIHQNVSLSGGGACVDETHWMYMEASLQMGMEWTLGLIPSSNPSVMHGYPNWQSLQSILEQQRRGNQHHPRRAIPYIRTILSFEGLSPNPSALVTLVRFCEQMEDFFSRVTIGEGYYELQWNELEPGGARMESRVTLREPSDRRTRFFQRIMVHLTERNVPMRATFWYCPMTEVWVHEWLLSSS